MMLIRSGMSVRSMRGGLLAVAIYCLGSGWASPAKANPAETKPAKPKKSVEQSVSFRLPRYFASLVDDDQREKLREIQAGYHARIVSLRMELDELEEEQLKAMERVLSTAQRKSLSQLRGDASRKSSAASKGGPKSSKASSKSASSKKSTPTRAKPKSKSKSGKSKK